jgi:DNA-binding transcriptional regulator YiaG
MSTKLSFKQGATAVAPHARSDFPTTSVALFAVGPIDRPVDFVRLLAKGGVSLKRARMVLDRLALKKVIAVEVDAVENVLSGVEKLGVCAVQLQSRQIDPRSIRDKQGLSQPEFACLYGLETDTVKNWEQGRNIPDGPARVLLGVIDRYPQAVINSRAVSSAKTFVDIPVTRSVETPNRPYSRKASIRRKILNFCASLSSAI